MSKILAVPPAQSQLHPVSGGRSGGLPGVGTYSNTSEIHSH